MKCSATLPYYPLKIVHFSILGSLNCKLHGLVFLEANLDKIPRCGFVWAPLTL